MHHAAIDGASGVEVLSVLFDDRPERDEPPTARAQRDEPPATSSDRVQPPAASHDAGSPAARSPSEFEMLWRGVAGVSRQPVQLLRTLRRSAPGVGRMGAVAGQAAEQADVLGWPYLRPPATRFNERISGHRRFAFAQLPLADVKAVKSALGLTVNDVIIALCAGALREWLGALGELPAQPLVAMVPVSIRTPQQRGTFGNRVSAMFVPIATDEADPRRRLKRAHEVMRAAKEIHRATPAELLQDMAEFIPPAVSARATRLAFQLVDRRRPAVNCVISNVPGPQTPVYCAGARAEAVYPVSVIVDGMGLNITVMSLEGQLNFGVVVDRAHVEGAWPLLDALARELDTYVELTRG
jgi:WS/DGAT/MGAT family acyltransferase